MDGRARSEQAAALAARLDEAAPALIAVIADPEPAPWKHVPAPGVWAIGKEAEHVIEDAGHQALPAIGGRDWADWRELVGRGGPVLIYEVWGSS